MGEALKPACVCPESHWHETAKHINDHLQGCPAKECKGKAAARALAVMVLDPKIKAFLTENDQKALDQARDALRPFGYPDLDALRTKLGL